MNKTWLTVLAATAFLALGCAQASASIINFDFSGSHFGTSVTGGGSATFAVTGTTVHKSDLSDFNFDWTVTNRGASQAYSADLADLSSFLVSNLNTPSMRLSFTVNITTGSTGGPFHGPGHLTTQSFSLSTWFATSSTPTYFTLASLTSGSGCDSNSLRLYGSTTLTTPPRTPVPEPATLALFGAGLLGFGGLRRRRAKQN